MRVNQSTSNQVQGSEVAGAKQSGKAAAAKSTDKAQAAATQKTTIEGSVNAELSSKGKEMARAEAVANSAPDVREEKIAEIKRRISEGRYNVDSSAVADRMVDDHIKMSGIS